MVDVVEPLAQPITARATDGEPLVHNLPQLIKAQDVGNHPDVPRPELTAMQQWWGLGDVLMGGTPLLKQKADELLPPLGTDEAKEEKDARVRKAVVTPFYSDQIDRYVARPFGRPITYRSKSEDAGLPDALKYLDANADGQGKTMSALGREHLFHAIHRSGDCLLVDLPTQTVPQSAAESLNRRPIMKRLSLADLLGWTWHIEAGDDGSAKMVTTGIRVWEEFQVKVGTWGTDTKRGVRIIQVSTPDQPGYSVLYEKQQNGDWVITQADPFKAKRIMLHTTWTQQITATMGKSQMTHLAELNLAYIQGDCEQQYGASYARISTTWTTGTDPDSQPGALGQTLSEQPVRVPPKRLTRGHKRHIRLPDGAQIGLLETTGGGLAAGRQEQDNLERRMERFGATHIAEGGVTATSIRRDDDRDTSNLRAWVTRTEDTITAALRDCADLAGATLPADFRVELFRDWSLAEEREQAMGHTFSAYDRNLIPVVHVHQQLRRYGILGPNESSDEVYAKAQEEAQERGNQEAAAAIEAALATGAMPPEPGQQPPAGGVPPKPPAGKPDTPDDDGA